MIARMISGEFMRRTLIQLSVSEILIRDLKAMSWPLLVAAGLGLLATTSRGPVALGDADRAPQKEGMVSFREVSSVDFPRVTETNDEDRILKTYPAYLTYVLEVGAETDAATARKLGETYQSLRRRYPTAAARFLKGLRFEMVQKIELMGLAPHQASTRSPEMRRWVHRFIKEWHREADEHLFRAVVLKRAE